MDGALKLSLLAALILFVSGQTFEDYRDLPAKYRRHVDKALEKANTVFGNDHHVAFHSLGYPLRTAVNNLYINAYLKVTTCKKDSLNTYQHRDECVTRKEQTPLIDCLVCTTNDDEELIDCGIWKEVKKGKRQTIRDKCRTYLTGESHIMGIGPQ